MLFMLFALQATGLVQAQSFKDFKGTWNFTIGGGDTGSGTATVNEQGLIKGIGASKLTQLPIEISGQVEADGKTNFTAAPRGMTSTGAKFSGQLTAAGAGQGQWKNPGVGLAGSWTAQRATDVVEALPTQQRFDCDVDGMKFSNPEARADVIVDTRSNKADFRVISILPNARVSMDVKTVEATHPGIYEIVNNPGWSTRLEVEHKGGRMTGNWDFKTLSISGKRASGVVNFKAPGHMGYCQFDLWLHVVDLSNIPIPPR